MHKCTVEQDFPFADEAFVHHYVKEAGYCFDDYQDLGLEGDTASKNKEVLMLSLEPCREDWRKPQGVVCKSPEEIDQFF